MAGITHAAVVGVADDGTSPVGTNEWNADHVVPHITFDTTKAELEFDTALAFTPGSAVAASFADTNTSFYQVVIQNKSNGTGASTDLVLTSNLGTDTAEYIDLGINSSGYTGSWGLAKDGYLYVDGGASGVGDLVIGTAQANTYVDIQVGGGAESNRVARFNANGINILPITGGAPTEGINLYTKTRAGRRLPYFIGPSGVDSPFQPALFGNNVVMWLPGNGTTVSIAFGDTWTARNSGTSAAQSHPTRASTNMLTQMKRARFGTGTTATGSSGIQSTNLVAWRGNAAGIGGFYYFARFGVDTAESAMQVLIGLSALNAALTGEPSAQNNTCGLIADSTDANFQILTRDGATASKYDTGVSKTTTGVVYDFHMFCKPNDTKIEFSLINVNTGTVIVDSVSRTSNLPVNTTFMYAQCQIRSTVGTTAKNLDLNRIYVETDT